MSSKTVSTLSKKQIDALLAARHKDVFAVLGLHEHPDVKGLVVRTFLPGACAVDVLASEDDGKIASLDLINEAGLFEGKLGRRKRMSYRLRVKFGNDWVIMEDAYRFGPQLNDDDLFLFCEGTQERVYHWMGAQPREIDSISGILFVLWAPNAMRVSVVGEFNDWDGRRHVMRKHPAAGIWEIFVPTLGAGLTYKYEIIAADGELLPLKADPYAFAMQGAPDTASTTVAKINYSWRDQKWMQERAEASNKYHGPVSIYEVHLGSWRRSVDQNNGYLSYHELAEQLIPYALEMGFTHLQLMPVSEFPFDGSWGYQPIGLYAPTCRFGSPDDFRYFVDRAHQQGLGVLIDWVPGHFPTDEHGIGQFDGSYLYEHEDLRKGFHPDWSTLIYNYGRAEVMSYLLSNAIFWLDQYHIDGLRVDAVASMLYLNYGRKDGDWLPNEHGGHENLEAIEFLKQVNSRVYFNYPGAMIVAEESTDWPGVSHPIDKGGLGFGFKWNMGWMNDTLRYMERDPIHRKFHHKEMTFGLMYGFSENFVLPLSHDEVVYGKGSLLAKMPGDDWQKFANLRAYFGFMWTHPGKKLLFMGGEFAQRHEWNHDQSLDWHLLEIAEHIGVQRLIKDLNSCYRSLPALHELDHDNNGFEWIDVGNSEQSIFTFLRKGFIDTAPVLVVVNLTPQSHQHYQVGVPQAGHFEECLNTDSEIYGGSNMGNAGGVEAIAGSFGGQPCQMSICIPPLATVIFARQVE